MQKKYAIGNYSARNRLLTGSPRYEFDERAKAPWGYSDLRIRGRLALVDGRLSTLITDMWAELDHPTTGEPYWSELVVDDALVEALLGPDYCSAN